MTHYINTDSLCWEIQQLMENNFTGTPTQRFNKAKSLIVETTKRVIEDNREGEIKEFKRKQRSRSDQ